MHHHTTPHPYVPIKSFLLLWFQFLTVVPWRLRPRQPRPCRQRVVRQLHERDKRRPLVSISHLLLSYLLVASCLEEILYEGEEFQFDLPGHQVGGCGQKLGKQHGSEVPGAKEGGREGERDIR